MRKSIFTKYFLICSAVILISFVCLGAVLLLVSSQYFVAEKKNQLMLNAGNAVVDARATATSFPISWEERTNTILDNYEQSITADFFITDSEGNFLSASKRFRNEEHTNGVSPDILMSIDNDGIYFKSSLDLFATDYHVVAMQFLIDGDDNGPYYMFAVSPQSAQDEYIWNIMELFAISVLIVMVFVFIIIYFGAMRVTKPIQEMAEAAKRFGQGDFSQKIAPSDTAEIAELANAMNDMAVSLSNIEFMRKSFVANVSHELRTPMTSIGGFIDGMLDGTISQSEYKKYFRIISSEVHRLTRLVRSMLNLSKIEAGEMELSNSNFSIIEPIVDTLVTFENRIEEKNIDIRGLDCGKVMVYADNDLVHQIIYNLIENAVKFVDESGYIEFGFRTEDGRSYISVRNSGEGLSEEELPLVFDRFYKADQSRGKDARGVGLGLYIVRSIINLHEGNIVVRSIKGEYTEFEFSLPSEKPVD